MMRCFSAIPSTEWEFQQFSLVFHANMFVEISEMLETKIAAMQVYESEARAFPHSRSLDALRATARRWGSMMGLHAAEAFELGRTISI